MEIKMFYKTSYSSIVGELILVSDGVNLIEINILNQKYFDYKIIDKAVSKSDLKVFVDVKLWLDKYFAGENPKLNTLPILLSCSDFKKSVLEIVAQIPYGQTYSYGDIAQKLSSKFNKTKMSAQAVGNAIGHNPFLILIPCHRVVGKNGKLTGYAGGIENKIKLLQLEGVDTSNFY